VLKVAFQRIPSNAHTCVLSMKKCMLLESFQATFVSSFYLWFALNDRQYCRDSGRRFASHQASAVAILSCLQAAPSLIHPHAVAGTKPILPLTKLDKDNPRKAAHTATGEKLRQKLHWIHHRMLFDFLPLFEDDPEVTQVTGAFCSLLRCSDSTNYQNSSCAFHTAEQFLHTWHLYQGLIAPSNTGFTVDMLTKAQAVGRSLMAQFETLAAERDPSALKYCTVTYGKMLFEPAGACFTRTLNHLRCHSLTQPLTQSPSQRPNQSPTHTHARTHPPNH
jgi:hypothetical protein